MKNKIKLGLPFKKNFRISQLFGNVAPMYTNMGLKGHNGLDFTCPTGTEIIACLDGVVEFVGEDSAAGKGVYLISDLGQKGIYRTIYWHLQSFKVNVGDKVKKGDILGISDNTGMSTGPHLHFGIKPVRFNGVYWEDVNHDNEYRGSIDGFNFFSDLDIGNYKLTTPMTKGIFVKKIQELLNLNGYTLKEDGIFGNATKTAVMHFQLKNNLVVDGIAGKKTLAYLLGGLC